MIEPSLQIGGGNWANKSDSLLGYHKNGANFYADELTFSRNSLASYTDANGLIQSMPYNLLQQSNTFNTTWTNSNTTETGGQADKDGGNTAWRVDTIAAAGRIQQSVSTSGVQTFSVYAKAGTYNFIDVVAVGGSVPYGYFDLSTGTIGSTNNIIDANIEDVGGGWYRCSITFNDSAVTSVRFYPVVANNDLTGTSGSIYIQDAQLNSGSTALPYFATTTRLNLARVDYKDNINGSLLLEPQRTNLVTYSEQIDNAAWSNTEDTTVSANATTAPNGALTAENVIPNATLNFHRIKQANTVSLSTSYTFSVYVKPNGYNFFLIRTSDTSNNNVGYDLINGTVTFTASGYTGFISEVGNGWYRLGYVRTYDATTVQIGFRPQPTGQTDNTISQFTGDGTSGAFIWGAQLEASSYATSYIPTLASSVTRIQDSAFKTGISDKIGQTEGVVFLDVGDVQNNGITGNQIWYFEMRKDQDNSFGLASAGGTPQPVRFVTKIAGSVVTEGEPAPFANSKVAIKYTATQFKLFKNGSLVLTVNKNIGGYVDIEFMESASVNLLMILKQFLIFPSALSDAECITLTTL
jgi:hypothetical protein